MRSDGSALFLNRDYFFAEAVGNLEIKDPFVQFFIYPWVEQFYLADEYSIDTEGRIFQRPIEAEGKLYFKDNPISSSLQRVLNYRSGKFRITRDNIVLVKIGGKITSLGIMHEPLEKIKPRSINR